MDDLATALVMAAAHAIREQFEAGNGTRLLTIESCIPEARVAVAATLRWLADEVLGRPWGVGRLRTLADFAEKVASRE